MLRNLTGVLANGTGLLLGDRVQLASVCPQHLALHRRGLLRKLAGVLLDLPLLRVETSHGLIDLGTDLGAGSAVQGQPHSAIDLPLGLRETLPDLTLDVS